MRDTPATAKQIKALAMVLDVSPAPALRDLRDVVRRGLVDASGTTNNRR